MSWRIALVIVSFVAAAGGLCDSVQAARYKVWVPQVTDSQGLDSPNTSVDPKKSGFVNGKCGVTVPEDGITVLYGDGSAYTPGYYKKIELTATICKPYLQASRYQYQWWQQDKGSFGCNYNDDQAGLQTDDTDGQWMPDPEDGTHYPSTSSTTAVDASRILYLFDAPGFEYHDPAPELDITATSNYSFRDRVQWRDPHKGAWYDVVRFNGQKWLPVNSQGVVGWLHYCQVHKPAGAVSYSVVAQY